jgi:hypothetical protein
MPEIISQIPIGLNITAELRKLDQNFIPHYILQSGNHHSGTILLSLIQADCTVIIYGQQRNELNKLIFRPVHKDVSLAPNIADEYIQRAMKRDPDLWVIEIETRDPNNFFETYFKEF